MIIRYALYIMVLLFICCDSTLKPTDPDISGVWRKISRIMKLGPNVFDTTYFPLKGWEFAYITKTTFIQKYDANCHFQVWEWSFSQKGNVVSKTCPGIQCQIDYTVTINRDTLIMENADIICKWVPYDTNANPVWQQPNMYVDMNKVAKVFCNMIQRYRTYWTDPINAQQLFNYEFQIEYFATDTIAFIANKIMACDTPAFVYFAPIIAQNEPVDSFAWQFGDGKTSNEMYPTNQYSSFGIFNVQLCVKYKDNKTRCICKENYIRVGVK